MSVKARLADGRVLQFPDGTKPEIIQRAVKDVLSGKVKLPVKIGLAAAAGTTATPTISRARSAAGSAAQGLVSTIAGVPESMAISRSAATNRLLTAFDQIDRGEEPDLADAANGGNAWLYQQADAAKRAAMRADAEKQVTDPRESSFYKAGEAIADATKKILPTDPAYQGEFLADVLPQGIGSTVGFAATALAARAGRIPETPAVAALGVTSTAPQQFQDALSKGASIKTAINAAYQSIPSGASEAVPIGHWLDRLDKLGGGKLRDLVIRTVKQGTEEGLQELYQQVAQNAIAQDLYDRKRGLFTGAGPNAAAGFTVGALMETLTGLVLPGKQHAVAQPGADVAAGAPAGAQPAEAVIGATPPGPTEPAPPSPPGGPGAAISPSAPTTVPASASQPATPAQPASPSFAELLREHRAQPEARQINGHLRELVKEKQRLEANNVGGRFGQQIADLNRRVVDLQERSQPLLEDIRKREILKQNNLGRRYTAHIAVLDGRIADARSRMDFKGTLAAPAAQPTPAQAEAGNYQKRHLTWEGLPIAIETEKGGIRRSKPGAAQPWEVKMPAAYGYVKGTEGKDGDQVDVYLGDHAEAPHVYVVDQINPRTRKFDEHKSFIGFSSVDHAMATYDAAFSDGSGPQRVGAIKTMTVPEFKDWVTSGNTKRPLGYVDPGKVKKPESLLSFIVRKGGIKDDTGELAAMDARLQRPGIINNRTGYDYDRMREMAEEAGYIRPSHAHQTTSINDLLDAITSEFGGKRQVAAKDVGAEVEYQEKQATERAADEARYRAESAVGDLIAGMKLLGGLGQPGSSLGPDTSDETAAWQSFLGDREPTGQEARAFVRERGMATNREFLVGIDANGKTTAALAGGADFINFSSTLDDALLNGDRQVVIHHNHPDNTTLSTQDIAQLGYPGMTAIWAHGHDGNSYRAALTDAARKAMGLSSGKWVVSAIEPRKQRIAAMSAAVNERIYKVLRPAVWAGRLTVEDAPGAHQLILMHALDRGGLIRFSTNVDLAFLDQADHFQKAVAAAVQEARTQVARLIGGGNVKAAEVDRLNRSAEPLRHAGEVGTIPGGTAGLAQGRFTGPVQYQGSGADNREKAPGATEVTGQGEQQVIPGAERITDRALIERKAEGPAKARRPQKDTSELPLFDTNAPKQGILFEQAPDYRREMPDGTPTTAARQRNMQSWLSRGQPIDRILRMPFDWAGGVDQQGRWKPGLRLTKAAGRIIGEAKFGVEGRMAWANPILETARAGLIDRYGLSDEYVSRDRKRALDERRVMLQGSEILKTLKDHAVNTEEAKVLQAILTGERVNDAEMAALAAPIRQAVDDLGAEAVSLGLVSPESFDRNRGTYLHRVYMKHEEDATVLGKWVGQFMGRKRKKIIGDQLKGRGMFMDVEMPRVMRDVPGYQEGTTGRVVKGDRILMLDRLPEQDELQLDERPRGQPRVVDRVFWPADQPIPPRYQDYTDRGAWEVRGMHGRQVTLWRDYTKPERESMGEILDSRYTIAKTFMLMAHDLATGRFYKDIAENEEWTKTGAPAERWIEAADFNRYWNDSTVKWVKVPDATISDTGGKKRYGALSGKFVRQEVWRDINELQIMNRPNLWRKILTSWKLNKTARSPVVHMNNVMSNFLLMDMADIRMQDLVSGIRSYARGDADYQDAVNHGVFGADMMSSEIRKTVLEPVLRELQQQATGGEAAILGRFGGLGKLAEGIWGRAKWADAKMIDFYRIEDDVFRMASYMRHKATGLSAEDAAAAAREEFIDYDIRAPWVNAARNSVLPFISYTYRAAPLVARMIATRPWKLAKYMLLAYLANAMAYMLMPGDEDEERRSLDSSQQGRTWIGTPRMMRMPWRDRYGNPMFLDIRRWIPAGDVFDIGQGSSAFPIPAPINLGGPLMLGAELLLNKSGFTGDAITNDLTDTWMQKGGKVADYVYKAWMPSAAWVPGSWYWQKIADAGGGVTDAKGRALELEYVIPSAFGVKLKPQDVETGFYYQRRDVEAQIRAFQDQAREERKNLERKRISKDTFDARLKTIQGKIKDLSAQRSKLFPHSKGTSSQP